MNIPYPQLHISNPPVIIFDNGIADVEGIAVLDVVEMGSFVESDGGNVTVGLGFLDKLELEMAGIGTYTASVAVVVDVFGKEDGSGVAGTERLELLQDPYELRGNTVEIEG